MTSLSVHISKSICKTNLNLKNTKLHHDRQNNSLIQDQFQFTSKSSPSSRGSVGRFMQKWDHGIRRPVSPNRSDRLWVFLTSYRMIYPTCIHSQTSWARHNGIYYGIYKIGINGPSVRICGS